MLLIIQYPFFQLFNCLKSNYVLLNPHACWLIMINLNPLGCKNPRHKHDCSRFRFSAGRGDRIDRSRLRMAHAASSGGVRGEGGERGEGDGEGIRCARSGGGEAGVKGSISTSCGDGTMPWTYRYTHTDTCNQCNLFYSKSLNIKAIKVHPAIRILHFGGERSLWSGSQFLQNQYVDSRSSRDPFIPFWWACVRFRKPRLLMPFGIERPTLKFHPVQAVPLWPLLYNITYCGSLGL